MNFGAATETLYIRMRGFSKMQLFRSVKTVITSTNVMDENSFSQPTKVPFAKFVEFKRVTKNI